MNSATNRYPELQELLERIVSGEGGVMKADAAAGLRPATFSRWTNNKHQRPDAALLGKLAASLGEKYRFTEHDVLLWAGYLLAQDGAGSPSVRLQLRSSVILPGDSGWKDDACGYRTVVPDEIGVVCDKRAVRHGNRADAPIVAAVQDVVIAPTFRRAPYSHTLCKLRRPGLPEVGIVSRCHHSPPSWRRRRSTTHGCQVPTCVTVLGR